MTNHTKAVSLPTSNNSRAPVTPDAFVPPSRRRVLRRAALPRLFAWALLSAALLWPAQPAVAQFIQSGNKLVGTGGGIFQGRSVALSADGGTALVGSGADGGAWVFIRDDVGALWIQQGSKLFGSDAVGSAYQGFSVALSADGNTAIIGGLQDNTNTGAAWVFTRSNGVWTQQGPKLVGLGAVGAAQQGVAVALSADGNTAIIGGPEDNGQAGASWVFTRSNGVWTQQGFKLVGIGAVGAAQQGFAVALSADGNTAIVGGRSDNSGAGASWVFTRTNGVWTQQGGKLVGSGAGAAAQGRSVALSADGNTAVVGGPNYAGAYGSAWVFTRSGGVWTQQGSMLLVGIDNEGPPAAGASVALSADGNTALVGGPFDNYNGGFPFPAWTGAAWVFTRSGGAWTQQGFKLVGIDAVGGEAQQGAAVALSGDGKVAILGGPVDNGGVGAAWVFVGKPLPTATHDFDGDGRSDILWRDTSGNVAIWQMSGSTIQSTAFLGNVPTSWTIVGQRDFNGDGFADILWRDNTGNVAIWFMNGTTVQSSAVFANVSTSWSIVGTGDFHIGGDVGSVGKGDILWRDTSGNVAIWFMNGTTIEGSAVLGNVNSSWSIVGTGDFNGDGKRDILWRDTSGTVAIWLMNGTTVQSAAVLGHVDASWSIVGTGDFNLDGKSDILWRDTSGKVALWFPLTTWQATVIGNVDSSWTIAETGDFNNNGISDILWRDSSGNLAIWFMSWLLHIQAVGVGNVPTSWAIQGTNVD